MQSISSDIVCSWKNTKKYGQRGKNGEEISTERRIGQIEKKLKSEQIKELILPLLLRKTPNQEGTEQPHRRVTTKERGNLKGLSKYTQWNVNSFAKSLTRFSEHLNLLTNKLIRSKVSH